MNNDLTRAQRKLAQLKRRAEILQIASKYAVFGANGIECRRMARELAREIKAQQLECRRLALWVPWEAVNGDGIWTARSRLPAMCDVARRYIGRNAKARAVAWAEKMNRKAGAK